MSLATKPNPVLAPAAATGVAPIESARGTTATARSRTFRMTASFGRSSSGVGRCSPFDGPTGRFGSDRGPQDPATPAIDPQTVDIGVRCGIGSPFRARPSVRYDISRPVDERSKGANHAPSEAPAPPRLPLRGRHWEKGWFGGPPWGGGHRARRGDVRTALLSLLADTSMHGYDLIRELEQERRRGGRARDRSTPRCSCSRTRGS